jgi:multidrug efflux pump
MLGVTLFGIFLTPVFFYVIQWFGRQPPPAEAPPPPDGGPQRPTGRETGIQIRPEATHG